METFIVNLCMQKEFIWDIKLKFIYKCKFSFKTNKNNGKTDEIPNIESQN